jgi:hypothetical protein
MITKTQKLHIRRAIDKVLKESGVKDFEDGKVSYILYVDMKNMDLEQIPSPRYLELNALIPTNQPEKKGLSNKISSFFKDIREGLTHES